METSPAFDFATEFSAHMLGMTSETYLDGMKATLGMLDEIEDAIKRMKIKSEDDFKQAYGIKGRLNSLSCYTSNHNLPENNRVWQLEMNLGEKMNKYALSNLPKGDDNLMIRYILWNRHIIGDTDMRKWILDQLVEKGYIGKYKDEGIVITGLSTKVGDNVFTVGSNGREYRNYRRVCVPQCYELTWGKLDLDYLATKNLPTFDDLDLHMTHMGEGKHNARYPKITNKDKIRLKELMLRL